jgi:hypothetical protein
MLGLGRRDACPPVGRATWLVSLRMQPTRLENIERGSHHEVIPYSFTTAYFSLVSLPNLLLPDANVRRSRRRHRGHGCVFGLCVAVAMVARLARAAPAGAAPKASTWRPEGGSAQPRARAPSSIRRWRDPPAGASSPPHLASPFLLGAPATVLLPSPAGALGHEASTRMLEGDNA